jgi:gas vesicle protein
MEFVKRIVVFGLGGIVGGGIGAAVASLMAPQSGEELQGTVQRVKSEAMAAGDAARTQTREAMIQRFRDKVNDQSAFTGKSKEQIVEA